MKGYSTEFKDVVTDLERSCNHFTAALYCLSAVEFLYSASQKMYLASVECIDKTGNSHLPLFIHDFAKSIFHLKQQSYTADYMADLSTSIIEYMPNYNSMSFIKFGVSRQA